MPMRCRAISSKDERAMRRVSTAVLIFLGMSLAAQAQVQAVNLITPRLFGHFVGDVLKDEVDLRVGDGVELVSASVPQPGSLDQCSNFRAAASRRKAITARRSTGSFSPIRHSIGARCPAIGRARALRYRSSPAIISIPWKCRPGRSVFRRCAKCCRPRKPPAEQYMQPYVPPPVYDVRRESVLAFSLLAATLAALVLLAHHLAWWPFGARARRPFTEASRTIRNCLRMQKPDRPIARRSSLSTVPSIRRPAGAVFSEDVPAFLAQHPAFARMQDQFMRFFASSQSIFFSDKPAAGIGAFSPAELNQFSNQLAAAERAAS